MKMLSIDYVHVRTAEALSNFAISLCFLCSDQPIIRVGSGFLVPLGEDPNCAFCLPPEALHIISSRLIFSLIKSRRRKASSASCRISSTSPHHGRIESPLGLHQNFVRWTR